MPPPPPPAHLPNTAPPPPNNNPAADHNDPAARAIPPRPAMHPPPPQHHHHLPAAPPNPTNPPHPAPHPMIPNPPVAIAPVHPTGSNDYCALFVALIGEGPSPQGVVNTSEGRVVRAFHRFTLLDQSGRGQDVTKGRRRDQGAVKISCARQDPNARNCHGYRKFVKKSILEDPNRGLLVNDTIVIRYQIELVVSTGGALSRHGAGKHGQHQLPSSISVPPPSLGRDLAGLLDATVGSDVTFDVDGEQMCAHKIVLQARSPVFRALLTGPLKEGNQDVVAVHDVRAPVFRALLHFAYSDALPEELSGAGLEVTMAQHLLAAADRFQLLRLRCICEQRLCETVEVETVATTLALAEQNNANELKRVCLEFVSKHLQAVMATDGYKYMTSTCPQLQTELLAVIATSPPHGGNNGGRRGLPGVMGGEVVAGTVHPRVGDESSTDGQMRRVRQRRE